jgi:mannose-1-phosphate guanylyltransferase
MLQMTVDRLGSPWTSPDHLWILTNAALVDATHVQLPDIPKSHIIGEPCKRDTAPCIGLAALLIARTDPQATMVVMPSDHVIKPAEGLMPTILAATAILHENPSTIVTFGIRPTHAATTFGYIERGEKLPNTQLAQSGLNAYKVTQFREKPPAEVAKQYVAAGNFYWNSGMFVWSAATIISALEQHQPEMLAHLQLIADAWEKPNAAEVFAREFAAIKGISIDYAVMEHARDVAVIEAPFTWDDVGTWQAVARLAGADAEGNTVKGRHIGIDTHGSIIRTSGDHLVVTVGVNDLIVVHTPDATLVANRHDEESIRRVVKLLEERGWSEYL